MTPRCAAVACALNGAVLEGPRATALDAPLASRGRVRTRPPRQRLTLSVKMFKRDSLPVSHATTLSPPLTPIPASLRHGRRRAHHRSHTRTPAPSRAVRGEAPEASSAVPSTPTAALGSLHASTDSVEAEEDEEDHAGARRCRRTRRSGRRGTKDTRFARNMRTTPGGTRTRTRLGSRRHAKLATSSVAWRGMYPTTQEPDRDDTRTREPRGKRRDHQVCSRSMIKGEGGDARGHARCRWTRGSPPGGRGRWASAVVGRSRKSTAPRRRKRVRSSAGAAVRHVSVSVPSGRVACTTSEQHLSAEAPL